MIFRTGDFVKLKSGQGTVMVVVRIDSSINEQTDQFYGCLCQWEAKDKMYYALFSQDVLVHLNADELIGLNEKSKRLKGKAKIKVGGNFKQEYK